MCPDTALAHVARRDRRSSSDEGQQLIERGPSHPGPRPAVARWVGAGDWKMCRFPPLPKRAALSIFPPIFDGFDCSPTFISPPGEGRNSRSGRCRR